MNYYKRHLGDYAKKAGHLSALEHGVYTLILDAYYDREQAPTEQDAMRWARARNPDETQAVTSVLQQFFILTDGRYVQGRVECELASANDRAEHNRQVGKLGGRPPRARKTNRVNYGLQSGSENNPNPLIHQSTTEQDQKLGEPAVPKVAPRKIQLNLPDWLSPNVWQDWHHFRNARKGWTFRARELSLAKLGRLRDAGHDPAQVIEQSIECGWTGLFELKKDRAITSQTGPTSKAGQAILLLERLKNEQRRTDIGIPAKAALLGFGGHASG